MKKILTFVLMFALSVMIIPLSVKAAGGIYASGGGTITVGQSMTINVTASGATFDTVSGSISVSGPVSVTSFTAGDATWINRPTNGGSFNGAFLGDKRTSFTIATIKLKGTGVGSGAVTVSGASLKNAGAVVGSGTGSAGFTIQKAPDLPGAVKVTSSSHPDQNAAYDATTILLAWEKASGVDGFSYLLDQAATTAPASKITDANTSATFADKAVGTYYFHIKAHKADGWGGATHFKINIKEPDAKIDETLSKPSKIQIGKADNFVNNISDGTFTGLVISGITEPGFTANLTFAPVLTVPAGKVLTALADETGKWSLTLDYPIASGFHKLTVQGQKEKILTPVSDEIIFEISQKDGGTINILTSEDEFAPVKAADAISNVKKLNKTAIFYGIAGLALLGAIILIVVLVRKRLKAKGLAKAIKN